MIANTRNEFCTIFDTSYLLRALVLYRSLAEVCADFRLRAFCIDKKARRFLERMELPNLVLADVEDLERHDPELAQVKSTRTRAEYCWTARPCMCIYILEREPDVNLITYLDADYMFFHDPGPLFDELGDASVLVTPHRMAPGWWDADHGRYVAHFLPFRRDDRGLTVLRWWRERCLEWCYDRDEGDRYGDQKYLDDWPERFPGVHVLEHPGGGVGPWNVDNHALDRRNGEVLIDGEPLIFYHYVALWLYRGRLTELPRRGFLRSYYHVDPRSGLVWAQAFPVSARAHELVVEPYVERLGKALADVRGLDPTFAAGLTPLTVGELAYSSARWLLPRSLRRSLKQLLLRERRGRGPPGSPEY